MNDKNNLAAEMLRAWQDHLQNTVQDHRFSEMMVDQFNKFQDIFQGMNRNEESSKNSDQPASDDVNVKLAYIADRLEAMEARLTIIEKSIAGDSKPRKKRG